MTEEPSDALIGAIRKASATWIAAFNAGDAGACAACYEQEAVMRATPFGEFTGRAEIEAFWAKIIGDGFADVEYLDPEIRTIDVASAVLSSKWRMNKAHGIITKELWALQPDGSALLREDDFEVLG